MTLNYLCFISVICKKSQNRHQIYTNSQYLEPPITQSATKRAVEILDANYEKADLPAVIKENCTHLSSAEQMQLLQLLQTIEQLFDGTPGDWKTSQVKLALEHDAKPYYSMTFPIPCIHKKKDT